MSGPFRRGVGAMAPMGKRATLVLVTAFLCMFTVSVAFQQYTAYEQGQRDAEAVRWAQQATGPQTRDECLARRRDLSKAVGLYQAAHEGGSQPGLTDLAGYGATVTDCPASGGIYSMTSSGGIVCSLHGAAN
jgi:hypothetical protein